MVSSLAFSHLCGGGCHRSTLPLWENNSWLQQRACFRHQLSPPGAAQQAKVPTRLSPGSPFCFYTTSPCSGPAASACRTCPSQLSAAAWPLVAGAWKRPGFLEAGPVPALGMAPVVLPSPGTLTGSPGGLVHKWAAQAAEPWGPSAAQGWLGRARGSSQTVDRLLPSCSSSAPPSLPLNLCVSVLSLCRLCLCPYPSFSLSSISTQKQPQPLLREMQPPLQTS